METPEQSANAGAGVGAEVGAPAASAPSPAPVETTTSPQVVDLEADAFRRAMGIPPEEVVSAPAADPAAPEQTELELSEEAFTEFLSKELPVTEPAPDAAAKPEGLSDDDWNDLQMLRAVRQKDEATTQQLAEARAKILGDMPQFEVTEDAFKAALDGDAATFSQVVNATVRTGAEHAVQAMLGKIAPYMEQVQAQFSTMIYESVKDIFCSTVPGADKMRGNQHFELAISHVAKASPETGIVQALHKAMELTNRAYADTDAVRKGGGKIHDVRPAGGGGGVQGGVRQAAPAPSAPDPINRMLAQAWGIEPK